MELTDTEIEQLEAALADVPEGGHPYESKGSPTEDGPAADESLSERLHRVEETHEAILGSIADGVYSVDQEWRITSFNRAAEDITGLEAAEVIGRQCRDVLETDRCTDGCPLALTLEREEDLFDYEVTLYHRTPQAKKVGVNTAVLADQGGEPMGGVITFRRLGLEQHGITESSFEGLVGRHPSMLAIYDLVSEVADSDATVLILGESGTGKELVANALVRCSHRRDNPFVRVNCSVFPETLLESELFGHVKGAFTDARTDRIGRFERADGGTIFLDELGEISPAAQVKLLRVLESGEFERLGSSETRHVDVRVIAATNQDLPRRVKEDQFRDDLYYRLNVIQVVLPPLRSRLTDIPLLLDHFLAKYRQRTGKSITRISDRAIDVLLGYNYPGNVRELENAVEHAFARTTGGIITEEKLPPGLRQRPADVARYDGAARNETREVKNREAARILECLEQARWNRTRAAGILGISRVTLWRRMRSLGILDPEPLGGPAPLDGPTLD